MPPRNGFGDVDRKKRRFAPETRGRDDGVQGDLALERSDRHERIDRGITHHLGDLVGIELRDGYFFGTDTRFREDDAEQPGVHLGPADHADAMTREIADLLDLRFRFLPARLVRRARRRPQNHDVLAQNGDGLGALRHVLIGPADREIGFAGSEKGKTFNRAGACDQSEPDRTSIPVKGLRQRLNQVLVFAPRRPDGNSQGGWPQDEKGCAGNGCEDKQPHGQDQKPIAFSFPALERQADCAVQSV